MACEEKVKTFFKIKITATIKMHQTEVSNLSQRKYKNIKVAVNVWRKSGERRQKKIYLIFIFVLLF